jgi:ankyrin repeat protein
MPAAQEGHLAIVRLLLSRCRLDVNAQNSGGASAIFFAAKYGRVGVVRYLLRDGMATADDADADDEEPAPTHTPANPNLVLQDGTSPLYAAAVRRPFGGRID